MIKISINFLKKYFPAIILFILKNYFGLDFINDFNPFASETTKFFNGNSGEGSSINPPSEGEGSNRQNNNNNNNDNNNNTPNQDSSRKDPEKELREIFLKAELALEEEQIKDEMERKEF
jgi:hypothetical protein